MKGGTSAIRSFQDLVVWQKARTLVKMIYHLTMRYPACERFGLALQTRRSAVSVPSNIAEGYGRGSLRDYIRFLQISRGSLNELLTQLILAVDLNYFSQREMADVAAVVDDCSHLLRGLLHSLAEKDK